MRPPVQGLSQLYTWPAPTGTDKNSCKMTASVYLHFKQLALFFLMALIEKCQKKTQKKHHLDIHS